MLVPGGSQRPALQPVPPPGHFSVTAFQRRQVASWRCVVLHLGFCSGIWARVPCGDGTQRRWERWLGAVPAVQRRECRQTSRIATVPVSGLHLAQDDIPFRIMETADRRLKTRRAGATARYDPTRRRGAQVERMATTARAAVRSPVQSHLRACLLPVSVRVLGVYLLAECAPPLTVGV